jgi:hypothetical protein
MEAVALAEADMHALGEFFGQLLTEVFGGLAYHTTRIVLRILSLGLIRVQGTPGNAYPGEPDFGWHNVIWKWDGRHLWLACHIAYFAGLFLWGVALAALFYFWRNFA